jgi:hypothetical protein
MAQLLLKRDRIAVKAFTGFGSSIGSSVGEVRILRTSSRVSRGAFR